MQCGRYGSVAGPVCWLPQLGQVQVCVGAATVTVGVILAGGFAIGAFAEGFFEGIDTFVQFAGDGVDGGGIVRGGLEFLDQRPQHGERD